MGLTRSERVRDLCERYGAAWAESPAEMLRRMSPDQRAGLDRLGDQQTTLLERLLTLGERSPLLDGALAACAAGEVSGVEQRVNLAGVDRRLMRRALGLPHQQHPEVRPRRDAVNVLSLCTGIGGLDLGLAIAAPETKVVCYVEKDRPCQELLRARMAGGDLDRADILDDLTEFDGRPWRGAVDLVAGGYPCQPFSTAGKRQGAGDEKGRHLWPAIRDRVLREILPERCLFENVGGHLSLGAPDVVRDLVGLGYRVALGLFPASEVGAPHKRERLFILAHRAGLPAGAEQAGPRVAERRGGWRQGAGARGEGVAGPAAVGDPGRWPVPDGQRPRLRQPRWPEVWSSSWGRPRLWPPRPDSWAAWRGVRALDPSLVPRAEGGINPAFVEWTMGFPRGWTEGMSRTARLRALGNAVVPAVAALAWHELSAAIAREHEDG